MSAGWPRTCARRPQCAAVAEAEVALGGLDTVVIAEVDRLRELARFRSPAPIEIPWGRTSAAGACYLRDPDGITIQLMQHPAGGSRFDAS
jgi:hypothetical protein